MSLLSFNTLIWAPPAYATSLKAFQAALESYLSTLQALRNHNEPTLVSHALKPFFDTLGFQTIAGFKQKGKSEIDLALLKNGTIEVIIEAKKPSNKEEMFSPANVNCRALHECILYYLRERDENLFTPNTSLTYIIITDFYKFYIFTSSEFKRLFESRQILNLYKHFTHKKGLFEKSPKNEDFYTELKKILNSAGFVESIDRKGDMFNTALNGYHFTLQNFPNLKPKELHRIATLLSTEFLYDECRSDPNAISEAFYQELLHILGLKEIEQRKIIIDKSQERSLAKHILAKLVFHKAQLTQEELFEKTMGLLIIWLNRILFLKLIEAKLLEFNDKDTKLCFLTSHKIKDFATLEHLFFDVLAKDYTQRKDSIDKGFSYLPYLNSSLFSKEELEKDYLSINDLDSDLSIRYYPRTNLKDKDKKPCKGSVSFLAYLFDFLNAFNFGLKDNTKKDNTKQEYIGLIKADVLGNVFERLNGYKEGSFYTPSFITSYMCKEAIDKAVVEKFNTQYGFRATNLAELQEDIKDSIRSQKNQTQKEDTRQSFKKTLLSLTLCDPSVGSGHFLVSALNYLVFIHWYLNLALQSYEEENEKTKKFEYKSYGIEELQIIDDEIILLDSSYAPIRYTRPKALNKTHRIQKELFTLKKEIIESCLFGVDINPISCHIAQLRLWIELLKSTYYTDIESLVIDAESPSVIASNEVTKQSSHSERVLQGKTTEESHFHKDTFYHSDSFSRHSERSEESTFVIASESKQSTSNKDISATPQYDGWANPQYDKGTSPHNDTTPRHSNFLSRHSEPLGEESIHTESNTAQSPQDSLQYTQGRQDPHTHRLETLPNIDINIKCGNSLVSSIALDITKDKMIKELKARLNAGASLEFADEIASSITSIENKLPLQIEIYKNAVNAYKNETIKELKNTHKQNIESSKNFIITLFHQISRQYQILKDRLAHYLGQYGYYGIDNAKLDSHTQAKLNEYLIAFNFHKTLDIPKDSKSYDEKHLVALVQALQEYENLRNTTNTFEWRFAFPEVLDSNGDFVGFDIIIGNPPYIVTKKSAYPQYKFNTDTYLMFFEKGLQLLKSNAYLSFITPRFWLVNKNCKDFRSFMLHNIELISLSESNPFELPTTENVITLLKNTKPNNETFLHYKESKQDNDINFELVDSIAKNEYTENENLEIIFYKDKTYKAIFKKIEQNTLPLKSISESKRGAEYSKKFCNQFSQGRKILLGYDVTPYCIKWNDTYIDENLKDIQRLKNIFDCPTLIYLRRVDNRLSASVSDEPFAFIKNIYGIKVTNTAYSHLFILALINSRLLNFYYLKKFTTKKEEAFPEIQTYLYEKLPIPKITESNQNLANEIVALVEQILESKAKDSSSNTKELESQIDKLVYRLYNLANEEISIIDIQAML